MRARGERFAVAEIAPPPVPPEDNGAGLFLSAILPPGKVVPDNIPAAMRSATPRKAVAMVNRPAWAIQKRGQIVFNTNGVTALWWTNTGTETLLVEGKHVPMLVTQDDLRQDIASASNALEKVRAALQYRAFDFQLDYSAGFSGLPFAHLSRMKAPASWLRAASLSALYQTNFAEARDQLVALAKLSQVITNEALLISQLVRIAIFQIGVAAVWEALQADGWNDADLAAIQNAYGDFAAVGSMERAMEMERALGILEIDRMAADDSRSLLKQAGLNTDLELPSGAPQDLDELTEPLSNTWKNGVALFNRFIYAPVWKFAWKDQDKLHALRNWQRILVLLRSQGPQSFPSLDELSERPESFYDRIRYLASSLLGNGPGMVRRTLDAEAARNLVVAAVAIRRFQLARGELPGSLSELVPRYLAAVPIDPFDGDPLRYRREANGTYLLYSIGRDGRDEHGDARQKEGRFQSFLYGRDLVWPQPASEREIELFEKTSNAARY